MPFQILHLALFLVGLNDSEKVRNHNYPAQFIESIYSKRTLSDSAHSRKKSMRKSTMETEITMYLMSLRVEFIGANS